MKKFGPHCLQVCFKQLISVILQKRWTVIVAHQKLVAVIQGKFTVLILVKACLIKLLWVFWDICINIAWDERLTFFDSRDRLRLKVHNFFSKINYRKFLLLANVKLLYEFVMNLHELLLQNVDLIFVFLYAATTAFWVCLGLISIASWWPEHYFLLLQILMINFNFIFGS